MTRLGLSTSGARTGGLVIGADGSMSAGTGLGAALAVAVVVDLDLDLTERTGPAPRRRPDGAERERVSEAG